ncbi:MAG: hypothetical protein FVQ82_02955 [Planctomycetes bacterium]|nr:hypothetical protein [Planctomycetota bacterium]
MTNGKPTVLKMVREAVESLEGETTNGAIVKWIQQHYPGTKDNTIQCTILSSCVNVESRINWPENSRPRKCTGKYDFLFKPGYGLVEFYDPKRHGHWELCMGDNGKMIVRQTGSDVHNELLDEPIVIERTASDQNINTAFAAEAHLRDYLAKNLNLIESGLELYVDKKERSGVEYPISGGFIDILALDQNQQLWKKKNMRSN